MNKKIAITGGIGSGKSTVCQMIRDMGYPVYSCDEIYDKITNEKQYISEIANVFPSTVQEGRIDREKLAQIVFNDESARDQLNKIAHPLVMQNLFQQMNTGEKDLVFAEVPLLFEGNFEALFDHVIVVQRDKKERMESVCMRDNKTMEQVIARINTQFDYDTEKAKNYLKKINAFVIKNEGDLSALKNDISRIIKRLL